MSGCPVGGNSASQIMPLDLDLAKSAYYSPSDDSAMAAYTSLLAPNNYLVLRAGQFDKKHGGGPEGLSKFFSDLGTSKPKHVVIHFHGGLVSRQSGEDSAADLSPKYEESGARPLFIIWETGWQEIVDQNLPSIFQEDIFKRILRRVTQFVRAKLDKTLGGAQAKAVSDLPLKLEDQIRASIEAARAGKSALFPDLALDQLPDDTALTPEENQQIQRTIESDVLLQDELQEIANTRQQPSDAASRSITAQGSAKTLMDPGVLDEITPVKEGAKGIVSMVMLGKHVIVIVASVIARFVKHRDHGAYLTIMEEIMREFYVRNAGKFLWDGMKKEVDQAFGFAEGCGGTALVKHLNDMWAGGVKPRITLVGHSAGSIYMSRLLKEVDAKLPPDFKTDVIFVAPACTFGVFADAVKVAGKRITGLRVFGMGNALELKDPIAGPLYPASLLYFVSGVLEDQRDMPLLGMERYYRAPYVGAGFDDITYVRAFDYLKRNDAFCWSEVSGGGGANCDMTSHGGWTRAPAIRESVLYIVREGYGYP